ncbi:MAG: hypothetical protein R3342_07130 [Lutibacter sp.]|uniref:hypothetical protein n=1 Tax=Lutibacter sp. TaxID=1925666 RepID=UPI00299E39F8|nr:hypothetical protein [Lutibacter sp.]MDX1829303.1 hypothetical protein [Lutibacter sp.]
MIETVKSRSEIYNIDLDSSIGEQIEYLKPIIEQFFDSRFKKSLDKLSNDIEKKGWKLLTKVIKILLKEDSREANIVKLLQQYGFIGRHHNSFKEIEESFEKILVPSKGNELINEKTISTFFEGLKFIKEYYVNNSYKNLYNTNQVLVNTLNSEDNFASRVELFGKLYDAKILTASADDAFMECTNCDPLTYRGVFQLRLNPKKLKSLKCPVCAKELTYFVPYELHEDIYNIVKEKDGLLLNALCNKLDTHNIKYQLNPTFLKNIEIDCLFKTEESTFIVEAKMYKINTSKAKLKSKIRKHFGKLVKDVTRLIELEQFKNQPIKPILLLNIPDKELLTEVNHELKIKNRDAISRQVSIINLSLLKFKEE